MPKRRNLQEISLLAFETVVFNNFWTEDQNTRIVVSIQREIVLFAKEYA